MGKKKKKKPVTPEGVKVVGTHRKARFDYHLEDRFEAGMILKGTEVKSLRDGKVQFKDAYATIKDGEAFLVGLHIAPYSHAGEHLNHDPERTRKLLLHKKEIDRLMGKIREKGLTLIPITVYFKNGRAKVEIALAKGKRHYDKRATTKERDAKREIDRAKRN